MSTAIYMAALIIGGCINPEAMDEVMANSDAGEFYSGLLVAFIIYDLLNMRRK